jgi:hypothetical protein
MIRNQSGNIFVYILIAVGLFAALMFTLSKSGGQEDAVGELSEGQSKILANEIIGYASTASNALVNMQQSGITASQIDFMLPSDSNFNTAPNIYKFFHPDGGGFNLRPIPPKAKRVGGFVVGFGSIGPGYYIGRFNNFEWTPTTSNDIIFAAHDLNQTVCVEINRRLRNDPTIPTTNQAVFERFFVDAAVTGGVNSSFTTVNCAACEEIPALCVSNGGASRYTFYSILEAE